MRWLGALVLILAVGCSRASNPPPTPETALAPAEATAIASVVPVANRCIYRGELPDPKCTPGAIDPRVTQANIHETICKSGYTGTVRPSTAYTNSLKRRQMVEYGVGNSLTTSMEEDHLVPLELGGDPRDPRNLWPEPAPAPNPKDAVEGKLHRLVCDGQMTLAEAQKRIALDWTTALP